MTAAAPAADDPQPACPLCGTSDRRTVLPHAVDRLKGRHGVFSLAACRRCGLVATRPQPSPARLGYYYDDMYSGAGGAAARSFQTGPVGLWVARYRVASVRRRVPLGSGSRVLELGCGYGAFLAELRRATGCSAIGVDQDAGSLREALDREHIDYRPGELREAGVPPGSLDSVLLFETLEHLRDPVAALRDAHALLRPGGHCVVEVPDFDGFWRRVFGSWWLPLLVPQHLFHFDRRTLRAAFEAAGFEVIDRRSMFFPGESTGSLGLWLNGRLRWPLRKFRLRASRPDGLLLVAFLAAWWLVVEVPVQALLVLAGRTGHQLMVGRKGTAAH